MTETMFVDCPCCGTRLELERKTGKIVKTWAKLEKKEGGDAFADSLKKMKEEKERLGKYFSQAPDSMSKHKKELLDKFEQEKQRIKDSGDTSRPLNPLDLD
ncbi:MAG: hypothetical protein WC421_06120 [Elusimicrobiales bacterium]